MLLVRVTIDVLAPDGSQVVGASHTDTTVNPRPGDAEHEASLAQVTIEDLTRMAVNQTHQRLDDWARAWILNNGGPAK